MRIVRLIMRVLFLTPLFIFIGLLGIILKSFGRDKPMTKSEKEWRDSGFSSGDPKIFISFMEEFKKSKPRPYMVDLTSTFNQSSQQLYQDSGHLNRQGNFIIAKRIALEVSKKLKIID